MANAGTLALVPVDDIELDRSNPRIRKFLEMYGESPTPEQIFLALGAGNDDDKSTSTTFEKLKQSILTNGGIIQPVIINKQADGRLVCIEGNTRVALYRNFIKTNIPGSWENIPALIHEDANEAFVHAIRLQVHLVGTRPWDPYSKAKYLFELRTAHHLPFATIVDYCGGRQAEVVEHINAYSDMEEYYRPILTDDGAFDSTRFSGFIELQKPGIKQAISAAGFELGDFAKWIHDGRLYPLQKVRILSRVLRHDKAREIFLKQGIRKAEAVLERPDLTKTLQDAEIGQLARALSARIATLTWSEHQRLSSEPGSETAQALLEVNAELLNLMRSLELSA